MAKPGNGTVLLAGRSLPPARRGLEAAFRRLARGLPVTFPLLILAVLVLYPVAGLAVASFFDDISGNGQTEAAHTLCTGIPAKRRSHYLVPAVGHYGIFSGRRWREAIAPRITDFIRRHG